MDDEKQSVLDAIEFGKYEVRFEPVDCVNECTSYDGTKFYVFEDNYDVRSCTNMGTCTISVKGEDDWHEFVYDMESGDWDGDHLCDDEEIIEALEDIDEFISCDDYDGDKQWKVYAEANHIDLNAPFYWSENEEAPKDIDNLGWYEIDVPLHYFITLDHVISSELMDMECTITDEELYDLFKLVKDELLMTESDENNGKVELAGSDIKKAYSELYETIYDQVVEQAENDGYKDSNGVLNFTLLLSKDLFEENLGGQ